MRFYSHLILISWVASFKSFKAQETPPTGHFGPFVKHWVVGWRYIEVESKLLPVNRIIPSEREPLGISAIATTSRHSLAL